MYFWPRISILSPHGAIEFRSARKHYILSNLLLKRVNPYVFLPESYEFLVLVRLLRFLLQITSNKGSNFILSN